MSFSKLSPGKELPHDIYVAIEIPANHAPIKYEIDKDTDCLMADRFMATPMFYPANYGYIPGTLSEDGDALDVLVVTPYPVAPGSVIRARPIGILNKQIEHFFENYKDLEPGKWVKVDGWQDAKAAEAEIMKARDAYLKDNG